MLKYLRSPNAMVCVGLINFGSTWNRPIVDSLAVVIGRIFKIQHPMLSVMLEKTVGRYTVSYCRIVREPLALVGEINSLWLHDSSLDFQRATCIVSVKKHGKQRL